MLAITVAEIAPSHQMADVSGFDDVIDSRQTYFVDHVDVVIVVVSIRQRLVKKQQRHVVRLGQIVVIVDEDAVDANLDLVTRSDGGVVFAGDYRPR